MVKEAAVAETITGECGEMAHTRDEKPWADNRSAGGGPDDRIPSDEGRGSIADWFDNRTGYRRTFRILFGRELPDGPKWGYSIAACLFWLTVVQVVSGFLMMATYSPSLATAWASVHFIEKDASGAFLRGVHYYAAQAMIALFSVHVIRVILTRAFRAPRELVWVTGLLLIPLVLVWAVTGNPLSGSQRGMSQIDVEGNILGSTPLIGPTLQRILIGGDRVGNLTLTHLYFLHVGLLPLLAGALLAVHIWQIYRHGLSGSGASSSARRTPYWPYQSLRNVLMLAAVLGTVAILAAMRGAPLEMPVDAEVDHMPRPEWYFLSLFELRRFFTGDWEIIATGVIPVGVLMFLVALPFIDRSCAPPVGTFLRWNIILVGSGAWIWLTMSSVLRDHHDAEFHASEARMAELSARARTLADEHGIPVEGAATLLPNDAKTMGPRLFTRHCSNCHSHSDPEGRGIVSAEPSAPDLYRFASREWIAGVLDPHRFAEKRWFGATKVADGDMASYVKEQFDSAADEHSRESLRQKLEKVALALAAEAARPDESIGNSEKTVVEEGVRLITKELGCIDCHTFRDEGAAGSAPDLTGYGSRDWLMGMISDPNHERFYGGGRNDRMPAFHTSSNDPGKSLLTRKELELLVDWLRADWFEPGRNDPALQE